jgi:hypothetical protein
LRKDYSRLAAGILFFLIVLLFLSIPADRSQILATAFEKSMIMK